MYVAPPTPSPLNIHFSERVIAHLFIPPASHKCGYTQSNKQAFPLFLMTPSFQFYCAVAGGRYNLDKLL